MDRGNGPERLVAGVDVGGTKVAVLIVDDHDNVCSRLTVPTILNGPESTLAGIVAAVQEAVGRAGADISDVAAVGVGVPGRVDTETGVVRSAVNLGWREMPVGEAISARLGVPCFLENDVRMAAIGVQRYMGSSANRNIAYVSIGTGIAAGMILDGHIYRGAHGLAGEIGHMIINRDGKRCPCGARGCLETVAAGPAIAALGAEAAASGTPTILRDYGPVTTEAVYSAARDGDAAAQEITRSVGCYLALALQQLIVAYDMECIVLGGGVSRAGEAFLQPILSELAHLRENSALTTEMIQPDMIRLLPPNYEAGPWGGVMLARG
ncbi:MAG: ROK family protein [Chloroflexota bacterium]